MLKPAVLYKEEIVKGFQEYFYTDSMLYETGCLNNWTPNISDSPDESTVQYAIVNQDNKLIGYLAYTIDWYTSKVYNFGLFSFDRGNPIIGREVHSKLKELVNKFHRIEWRAVSSNPACRGYDSFIAKYGGNKHVLKDAIRDRDGNYIDDIIYEIIGR